MNPSVKASVGDCAVTCRQIAALLDTVVDAHPTDNQLIDAFTAIAKLAKVTGDQLAEIANS